MTTVLLLLVAAVLVPAPVPALLAGGTGRWRLQHERRQRHQQREAAILWVLALAGELRAGSEPLRAVGVCTRRHGVAHRAARAARVGGDVAAALRADAEASGARILTSVAGAWDVAQRTGAGMADVLESMADGYRKTIEVQRTLEVELASPRASARMMSLLPAIGVLLAMALGADPIRWLTTTPLGIGCLVAGVGLNVAGFVWINGIVTRLERNV